MSDSRDLETLDQIETSLAARFSGGEKWPVDRATLSALIDIGFSDETIAGYFAVDVSKVAALRRSYGLHR
jgi:hypothetical protein